MLTSDHLSGSISKSNLHWLRPIKSSILRLRPSQPSPLPVARRVEAGIVWSVSRSSLDFYAWWLDRVAWQQLFLSWMVRWRWLRHSSVKPGVWRRNFRFILAYKFWWGRATVRWPSQQFTYQNGICMTIELFAGWPLNRTILPRNINWTIGIGLSSCRIGCIMTGNLTWAFYDGKFGLKLHVFLHLFFLLDLYFPPLVEKRIEQLFPLESEPTLSVWSRRWGFENLREYCCFHFI